MSVSFFAFKIPMHREPKRSTPMLPLNKPEKNDTFSDYKKELPEKEAIIQNSVSKIGKEMKAHKSVVLERALQEGG